MTTPNRSPHIRLTSHPAPGTSTDRFPIRWGAADPGTRGPVIGSVTNPADRNAIGSHGGSYSVYRALAISAGALNPLARPDLRDTHPVVAIGPHPQWSDPDRIVSLDPFGHLVGQAFAREIATGTDIRPSIAVTRARLNLPEILAAVAAHRIAPDGGILHANGDVAVTKIAIDPVWWLPGIARRFGASERDLRRTLFEQTGGMFPELVTRPDMSVFLPPIGGATVYIVGEVAALADPKRSVACRVHDECNGSDVFGSDICTCRPYLVHGIEECVQRGAGRRRGRDRLQPQGGPGAGRGDQVPRLQRPQAPGGGRSGRDLLRADGMRRRRPGRPLPGSSCPTCCTGSASGGSIG